jgi:hypothetical protein
LGSAVAALAENLDVLRREDIRRDLAVAVGVVVGPTDANPWGLPVSNDAEKWGVKVENIKGSLEPVESVLGCHRGFTLEVINFDSIPFQLYEDAVIDLSHRRVIVGISFDYPELRGAAAVPKSETHPGRHVARLTPSPGDEKKEPNIHSLDFKSDYTGDIWLFDDSGEMDDSDSLVSWPRLVRACWAVGGGLWSVREAGEGSADGLKGQSASSVCSTGDATSTQHEDVEESILQTDGASRTKDEHHAD